MRPMELKSPTKCCGASLLAWVKGKAHYVCPCGQVRLVEGGLPFGKMRSLVFGKHDRKHDQDLQGTQKAR